MIVPEKPNVDVLKELENKYNTNIYHKQIIKDINVLLSYIYYLLNNQSSIVLNDENAKLKLKINKLMSKISRLEKK